MQQGIHMLYPVEQMLHRAEQYEQEFAENERVTVVDWGCSYKQEQGYIVLEWDGEVDSAFLQRLDADTDVFDYCVYTLPSGEMDSASPIPLRQTMVHVA